MRRRAFVIIVSGFIGCSAWGQTQTKRSDAEISRYIQQRLELDPRIFSPDLKVTTREGEVTVSGTVATLGEEQRALDVAASIRGVNSVNDEIKVASKSVEDQELRSDVRTALSRNPAADAYEIDVGVANGVVALTGKVQSYAEKRAAVSAVQFVPGVEVIEDQITVEPMLKRSDSEILADIRALIAANPRLVGAPISAVVTNGHATISGSVSSLAQRDVALSLAQVQGVRDVTVNLDVTSLATRRETAERQPVRSRDNDVSETAANHTSVERDAILQRAANVYLAAHPNIDVRNVRVRFENGVARLDGTIATMSLRNELVDAIRNLGATQIVDQLQVRSRAQAQSTDVATAQRVRAWFNSDPYLADDGLYINIIDGRASLGGSVDSVQEKLRAGEIASQVQGVTSVLNSIQVPSQKARIVERQDQPGRVTVIPFNSSETLLRDRVRDQLFFDPFLDESRVHVTVDNQGVILTGTVQSPWARVRAVENAYQAGATRVIDKLTIEP